MLLNYYKILEIHHQASEAEIKKAYRLKAKKYHPDVNKSNEANQIFILVNEAYEVLKDQDKRKRYDLKLAYGAALAYEDHTRKSSGPAYNHHPRDRAYQYSYHATMSHTADSETQKLKYSPFIYKLFFASGMFAGFLLIFIPVYFIIYSLWPSLFILIAIPGIILVREGYKGVMRTRKNS